MPTPEEARHWYPQDPVHGFDHVLRVYLIAGRLAREEGAELEIVQAAVLLHDVEPPEDVSSAPGANRPQHHQAAARFAGEILRAGGLAGRAHRSRTACHPRPPLS